MGIIGVMTEEGKLLVKGKSTEVLPMMESLEKAYPNKKLTVVKNLTSEDKPVGWYPKKRVKRERR